MSVLCTCSCAVRCGVVRCDVVHRTRVVKMCAGACCRSTVHKSGMFKNARRVFLQATRRQSMVKVRGTARIAAHKSVVWTERAKERVGWFPRPFRGNVDKLVCVRKQKCCNGFGGSLGD